MHGLAMHDSCMARPCVTQQTAGRPEPARRRALAQGAGLPAGPSRRNRVPYLQRTVLPRSEHDTVCDALLVPLPSDTVRITG